MMKNIFLKTFRDQRISLFWWSFGMLITGLILVLYFPSVEETGQAFDEMIANLPKAITASFGASGITSLSTYEGFLQIEFFGLFGPALVIIFAILRGNDVVSNEEKKGTLELLLSLPINRSSLIIQKFLCILLSHAVFGLILWGTMGIGAQIIDININTLFLAYQLFHLMLLGLVFSTGTIMLSVTPYRKLSGAGIVGGLAVITHLGNAFLGLSESLEWGRMFSPFYYYSHSNPLINGFHFIHISTLFIITLLFLTGSIILFKKLEIQ